ncbi:hypothetical protein PACTADRAFT_33309 [Pachysolen tannophilus NRRL Y-2460]|uniref:Pre-rRNA-processing protein RIX1 N-terminal domain-containing protein n=1 Tax=Pachysolen tannophilus NRRL Y-2460 TaxID=669874 RepID=A0A1E4TWL4_PACTA|nr:hypothetical protein PACTADRAFT_33309 [Pachysolen tannophilus NRRL Y-2460]
MSSIKSILTLIENPQQRDLPFIIENIYYHFNTFSKTDQDHLCSRVTNLLKTYHLFNNFYGIKLIHVLLVMRSNGYVLSNYSKKFFINILKVLNNIKNFNNGGNNEQIKLVLKTSMDCFKALAKQIQGKPALTREVLTPNLPNYVSVLIDLISISPFEILKNLFQFLISNTSIFKPFQVKFKTKLLELLALQNFNKSIPLELKQITCECFVVLNFITEKESMPEVYYQNFINLIMEIKSVLLLYENFIDSESIFSDLQLKLPSSNSFTSIFPFLDIDVNDPKSILLVNERLDILLQLITSYYNSFLESKSYMFKLPLGYIVSLGDILSSFNLNVIKFKRSFYASQELSFFLNKSINDLQHKSIYLLSSLPKKFGGDLLMYLTPILVDLDFCIPTTNTKSVLKIDNDKILEMEDFIVDILICATSYLSLTDNYGDHSVINKLIQAALVLSKDRLPQSLNDVENSSSGNNKKRKKNGNGNGISNSSTSDLIFTNNSSLKKIPSKTIIALNNFFIQILSSSFSTNTVRSQISRYTILELLRNREQLAQYIKLGVTGNDENVMMESLLKLLKISLLFPQGTSGNILPFVSQILGSEDEFFSLFINPRLPPLPVKVNVLAEEKEVNFVSGDDESDEEEEKEEEVEEFSEKKRKIEEPLINEVSFTEDKSSKDNIPEVAENYYAEKEVDKYADEVFTIPSNDSLKAGKELKEDISKLAKVEDVIPIKSVETQIIESTVDDNDREDEGSDFEMPEIDVNTDDDEDEPMDT